MRIAILETGQTDPPDIPRHGTQAEMFETWLGPHMPQARFEAVGVEAGAQLPDPGAFDGFLITGSKHGVYDPLPWIAPLAELIRGARERALPVGGICFGHQIMAEAYGGRVVKHDGGWVVGLERYGPTAAAPEPLAAHAFHQDQVVRLPDGVAAVSGSGRCAAGRIDYAFPALSVQYHPEFAPAYMAALLDGRYDGLLGAGVSAAARNQLSAATDRDRLAADFARFFARHAGRSAAATGTARA